MKPITMSYALATEHLRKTGLTSLQNLDIKNKVHAIATEETVPSWTMAEWQRNVFAGYLPCGVLYEDAKVLSLLKSEDENGEYCHMAFTHEAQKGRIENTQEYVSTILSVLHEGSAPPITQVHCKRIVQALPFKGIQVTAEMKKQLKTFDPAKCNSAIEGRLKGLLQVARIFSSMGCVCTVVVAKKKDMPAVKEALVDWAKPIMAAQQLKAQILAQWRSEFFGAGQ